MSSIVRHIIGARARWLYYVLNLKDERLVSLGEWDDRDQPERSASELVSGLEQTWLVIEHALQHWTVADLETIYYDTDDNGEKLDLTLQWVTWHLIEHDLHHGGEISFVLGMHNIEAIGL